MPVIICGGCCIAQNLPEDTSHCTICQAPFPIPKDKLPPLQIVTPEELQTISPGFQKPETDEGYPASTPWYLQAGTDPFHAAWEWASIIAYDCKRCGGIVVGCPLPARRHMQELRVICPYCKNQIYQVDGYGI